MERKLWEVYTGSLNTSLKQELGLIRKPSSFISAICDERGQELLYAGMKISDVFKVTLLISFWCQ